jgi:hypothetical protein
MRRVLWSLGALAGVVLAAGVAYAASSLSTQQVGLSAEPPSAGAELAPAATPTRTPRPRPKRTPRPRRPKRTPAPRLTATAVPRVVATAVPTAVPTATTDDHGGRDDSSGRGSGKGDDRRDD